MRKFKKWLLKTTLGYPGNSVKLCVWMIFDNYVSSIPYAVMVLAMFLLFRPIIAPAEPIPTMRILVLCGILAVQAVIYYFVARKSYTISTADFAEVVRKARRAMGEQLRRLPMGFYNRRDAGDLTTVLLRDYGTVENNNDTVIPKAAVIIARMSMAVVVLTVFDWRMTLATLLVIPLSVPFAVAAYRRLNGTNTQLLNAQQDNTVRILEYVGGIQTLKAFNQTDEMYRGLRASCDDLRQKSIAMEKASAPVGMLARAVLNAGTAVVMGVGVWLMLNGSLSPLTLMVFLMMALNLYNPIMSFMMMLVNITQLNHCTGRINEIMAEPPLPYVEGTKKPAGADICFQNVGFGYGNEEVLHDVSFVIPQNSLTALVGSSGSGKSTITRLIARFWDAGSGSITIGGVPIENLSPEDVLCDVSMVFQDVYLFNDTIESNIRMGREGATREEVIQAARQAACHDFINALPNGYDTVVGEGGNSLSGGEKQRISIARALLKNAPIVLLDEATAALDPENEVLIQQAFNALVQNKTVVVIAHRLRSVQNADQIIVLHKGRVQQAGTHSDLLAENGLYKRLWNEQQKAGNWRLQQAAAKS
ncbi:MAG: ABC transporter ATP-binding protein [Oscillospiraceae bacterium]